MEGEGKAENVYRITDFCNEKRDEKDWLNQPIIFWRKLKRYTKGKKIKTSYHYRVYTV